MKAVGVLVAALAAAVFIFVAVWFADNSLAPLFFNSRIERLSEQNLPRLTIEKGSIVYCRMKADDFRFPLPPGSRAVNPVVTGGFDTVDGTVEARLEGTNRITVNEYKSWLQGQLQAGAQIGAQPIAEGLLIKFHYFGDR